MSKQAHAEPSSPTIQEAKPLAIAPKYEQPHQEILSSDIVIPRVLLMQGLSDFVAERKAQLGDIVRSTTLEKLADPDSSALDFVPLRFTSEWGEYEKVGTDFDFRKIIPRTPQNEALPWSFWRTPQGQDFDRPGQLGATEHKRVKSLTVYALLPRDVDAFEVEMSKALSAGEIPDLTKTVLPVCISFRSTSFKAGQVVSTFFAQVAEMAQLVPNVRTYDYVLSLSCDSEQGKKGPYYVFKVNQPKKLDPKYRAIAEKWLHTLSAVKDLKVDTTGDSEAVQEGGQY